MNELARSSDGVVRSQTIFSSKDGSVMAVNKRRLLEGSFFLMTNPPNNELSMGPAGASGGSTIAASLRLSQEGPMQITHMGIKRSRPCKAMLQIQDGTGVRGLMNAPCHVDTLFGNGGQLYPLAEGLYVDEARSLTVVFTNLDKDLAKNKVRVAVIGSKYTKLYNDPYLARMKDRMKQKQYLSIPYFYTLEDTTVRLGPLASAQKEIIIGSDHHFEIHQISWVSDGPFSLDIVDLTKGESIINAPSGTHYPLQNTLMCGTNQEPYRFHEPILIFSEQRLLLSFQDLSAILIDPPSPPAPLPPVNLGNNIFITLGGRYISTRDWS
jgi:hypothetical protein